MTTLPRGFGLLFLAVCGILLTAAPAHAEERLRIAVVLDASMSMNEQDPERLAEVAARLLLDLSGENDEVQLVTFGTTAAVLGAEHIRNDAARGRLQAALAAATRDQWCTDYRVGLQAALSALGGERPPKERKLVIFLTDGLFDPDRNNDSYYTTEAGRTLLEKMREKPDFAPHACSRAYKKLAPLAEEGFLQQMGQLTQNFSAAGVRLYTVGLGDDLASDAPKAVRSRQILQQISASTGGAFLSATDGAQLPVFFASIYSTLVGAPVATPKTAPAEVSSLTVEILPGARRAAIIADAAGDPALGLGLVGPDGGAAPFVLRSFNTTAEGANGYRVLALNAPAPGAYRVERRQGTAPLKVELMQEVGLRLAIENLPRVVPEGSAPTVSVGLRSAAGSPVPLSSEYLAEVRASLVHIQPGQPPTPYALTLDATASAAVRLPSFVPGDHEVGATAAHTRGLLDVAPVTMKVKALHQLDLAFAPVRIAFDVMADERPLASNLSIALAAGALPIPQTFTVDWSGVENGAHLVFEPTEFTLGPDARTVPVTVRLRSPEALRRSSLDVRGHPVIRAKQPELYKGRSEWAPITVAGRVKPWDWRRYFEAYRTSILTALALLVLLLWIIGRAVAGKWSKKARLHFVDLEDPTKMETTLNLARKSKSHLPFRSARHHCGRGGTPGKRSKKRYCTVVAKGPRTFRVIPRDRAVAYDRDGEERTTRKPFRGRWEERYRLGDRYEIWLTRS